MKTKTMRKIGKIVLLLAIVCLFAFVWSVNNSDITALEWTPLTTILFIVMISLSVIGVFFRGIGECKAFREVKNDKN